MFPQAYGQLGLSKCCPLWAGLAASCHHCPHLVGSLWFPLPICFPKSLFSALGLL